MVQSTIDLSALTESTTLAAIDICFVWYKVAVKSTAFAKYGNNVITAHMFGNNNTVGVIKEHLAAVQGILPRHITIEEVQR